MPIDPELLERIRKNDPTLKESLELSYQTPKLQAKDIKQLCEALSRNTTLASLDVTGNEIGAEGAKALAQNQTLTSLEVGRNNIGAEGVKALAQNQTLTSLDVASNYIGAEGAKALAQNQTLTSLRVGNNEIGAEGVKALAQNKTLTSLNVMYNEIGAEGAKALAQNQTLTSLDVENNEIGAEGAKALAQNQTLTSLNVWDNNIGAEGAKALAQNQTLTSLSVWDNNIGAEGAKALAQNQTLTSLDVSGNKIGAEGAKALAQNQTLTSLNVGNNEIGAEGAKALAQNQTLTSLNVSGNKIGAEGAKALAQNKTLTSLNVMYNEIGAEGAKALAQNKTLTSLDVENNEIGDEDAKVFIQALQFNYSLINFYYSGNQISKTNKQTLKLLIKRNCTLRDQFHHAAKEGDMDTLQKCLQQGVSLAATDYEQENTALHWAVVHRQKAVIKHLLSEMTKHKVEHYRRLSNKAGKTALDLARDSGDQVMIALLQSSSSQSQVKEIKQVQFSKLKNLDTLLDELEQLKQSKQPNPPKRTPSDSPSKPFATLEISFHIAQEELKLGKELGRGGFGIVFQGTWRYNDVAIKQLQSTQLSKDALEEFQFEMKIMARLRSPNIVQLYGITDKTPYCMVMEYLPKGDLYNLLHSNESISWEQRAQMALDIARGLAYLHHENILHLDLKSKNVLLDSNLKAKLADFGLAKIKTESSITSTGKIVGTLAWMAPELFKRKAEYTLKADMYSYGMVVWELSTRKIPFEDAKGNQSLIAKWVSEGEREEIPKETPKKLAQLIEASWSQEPGKRPTAAQAIEQLQAEEKNSATSNATKPSDYRSNFDSTSMDSGYRDNLDSDKSFRP